MVDLTQAGLEDKRVLVAGGAGEVGEGVVRAFLKAGARVIVPSRSQDRLADLRDRLGDIPDDHLFTIVADTRTEAGLSDLKDKIQRNHGALFSVVASLGGWFSGGDLHEIALEDWQKVIEGGLTAHFVFAKTFVPFLARNPGSSYTLLNGGAALEPVPKSGPVSIVAFAQIMLKNVLAYEQKGRIRVNTLLLATPVITRSRPSGPENWLTADDAGAFCVYLASRKSSAHGETVNFRSRAQLDSVWETT